MNIDMRKKISSEMKIAPPCFTLLALLTLMTLFTWFTLFSWFIPLTLLLLFKLLYTDSTVACMPILLLEMG